MCMMQTEMKWFNHTNSGEKKSDWYTFQNYACRVYKLQKKNPEFVGLNVTSFQSASYKYSNLVFFGVPNIYIFFIMK